MRDADYSAGSQDSARELALDDVMPPGVVAGAKRILAQKDFNLKIPDLERVLRLRRSADREQRAYDYAALEYVYARVIEHIQTNNVSTARREYRLKVKDKRQYNSGSLFALALRAECKMESYNASKIAVFAERAMINGMSPDRFKHVEHYGENKERAISEARRRNGGPRNPPKKKRRPDQPRAASSTAKLTAISAPTHAHVTESAAVAGSPLRSMEVSAGVADKYRLTLERLDENRVWVPVKSFPEEAAALFLEWCKEGDAQRAGS